MNKFLLAVRFRLYILVIFPCFPMLNASETMGERSELSIVTHDTHTSFLKNRSIQQYIRNPKVYLLVGYADPYLDLTGLSFLKTLSSNRNQWKVSGTKSLESSFKNYFSDSQIQAIVIDHVDIDIMANILQSSDTVGVFFCGHFGVKLHKTKNHLHQPLFLTPTLMQDSYGNNIEAVLQKIHPNVRFVSLVGCASNEFIKQAAKKLPESMVKKLKGNVGLVKKPKKSLKKSLNELGPSIIKANLVDKVQKPHPYKYYFQIERKEILGGQKEFLDPVVVFFDHKYLGTFPAMRVQEHHKKIFPFDLKGFDEESELNPLKFIFEAKGNRPNAMGQFKITLLHQNGSTIPIEWESLSAPRSDKPFGLEQGFLVYKPKLTRSIKDYLEFGDEN